MKSLPEKPIHIICSDDIIVGSASWKDTVMNTLQSKFSGIKGNYMSITDAATVLSHNPTTLNGVILTNSDVVSNQAAGIIECPYIFPSASVSASQGGKPRGVFSPLQAQVQESPVNPLGILHAVCLMLETLGLAKEAESLNRAIIKTMEPIELIGSNMRTADIGGSVTAEIFMETLLDHLHGFLQAVNSAEAASSQSIRHFPVTKRRPMGMIEKIMTHNGVGLEVPEVKPGDMICVKVGWILTSELLWAGMEKTYNQMKRPRLYRNDRLWLAVDHTVDPRTNHQPRQRKLIEKAEEFQREAKIIDFLPANTSIMHTDFTRERALPGQIVIGSDSHTCSSGSMGAFAVGFGAADVVLPMVTGETWFRVPEVCRIDFVGKLPFGSSGKDVILYILGVFKRNTIAFQRAVEYGGPGLKELSMDARFAISNMTTEFGGMGSCFEADENTAAWIAQRRHSQHRGGLYFRADPGSRYAERRIIDLSEVKSTIALYPNPDNVVPVAEKIGMKLDGCFIGACTTTEEDLIVGALILDAALKAGTTPVSHGKRRVTPGSLKIIRNLERRGLLDIYRQAKFDIGAPGCSYCVGINDVDVAGKGEVWLSSQNRNFRNRMGMGSFGNVTCAAVVAASSFNMTVTDPAPLWERLNKNLFQKYVMHWKYSASIVPETQEPAPEITEAPSSSLNFRNASKNEKSKGKPLIRSKVQRFAENVDTDAIIPAEFMPGIDNADLGSHCFQYYRPEFREKAQNGSRIIVAEYGFGSGSSREDAVRALLGTGIEAVIAKNFAFIYERNQLNMGLFNIQLTDEEFYVNAKEDSVILIDKELKTVQIDGFEKLFHYQHSDIEATLLSEGGVLPLYNRYGTAVFRHITKANTRNGGKSGFHIDEPDMHVEKHTSDKPKAQGLEW